MRRFLSLLIGITVSIVCLLIAFSRVSWQEFSRAFEDVSYYWLLVALALQLATVNVRAYRWQYMFQERLPFGHIFWTQAVGYLVNNLLPLRLGDFARIMLLRLLVAVSAFRIGFTIIMERFLDIVLTLLLLLLTASSAHISDDIKMAAVIVFAGVVLLLIFGTGLYYYCRRNSDNILKSVLKRFAKEYVHTLSTIFQGRPVIVFFLSASCQILSTLMIWAALRSFDHDATLWSAMLVTVTITFAMAIPSAPANLGVFQLAGQIALTSLFGERYSPATALAVVSTIHAIHFIGTTVLGAIGIWWLRHHIGNTIALREAFTRLVRSARSSN